MATVWIPTERFLAVLDECSITKKRLGVVDDRKVREWRTGRQEAISLDAVDRILTKLGLTEWMHLPKEQGGLGDLYFEEETFTPSWVKKAKAQLEEIRLGRQKYKTEEERLAGRRARQRLRRTSTDEERRAANRQRSYRHARRLGKRCKCGTQITDSASICHPCYVASIPRVPHGTMGRYVSQKCRCDLCKAASSRYHRDRRRRVKAEYLEAQRRAA